MVTHLLQRIQDTRVSLLVSEDFQVFPGLLLGIHLPFTHITQIEDLNIWLYPQEL